MRALRRKEHILLPHPPPAGHKQPEQSYLHTIQAPPFQVTWIHPSTVTINSDYCDSVTVVYAVTVVTTMTVAYALTVV